MNLDADTPRRPLIEPVLPLINVVFLLLIFFMVAGQLTQRPPAQVDTPHSQTASSPEQPDKLLLMLDADGQWYRGDAPLPETELANVIEDPTEPVRLLADADLSMTTLSERLRVLQKLGVEQVRLVTRNEAQP